MQKIWADTALTTNGWQNKVLISIAADGTIKEIAADTPACAIDANTSRYGALVPAPTNLHSHAFQRAMAGLTEARGPQATDSFWTWRQLMFRFLDHLSPDDIQSITAFVQMEMLESGYAAVGEFHYIHHQPGGVPYTSISELSERIIAAAELTGIGLTLLPVFYEYGGCDQRPLSPGQIRFGNNPEQFGRLLESAASAIKQLPVDAGIGVAPHSLRAVSREGLITAIELMPGRPLHIHLAEQVAEVEEITQAYGARPVEWLLGSHNVNQHWCLIHATQMLEHETSALAQTGAVTGLCPMTESSLGDGIFDGIRYRAAGGRFGIGSDSNIRISLSEELRTLEYSQRLRDRGRAMFATPEKSTGRVLLETVATGGASAIMRNSGTLSVGRYADLLALDNNATDLLGKSGDALLDSYIFAANDDLVTDVWAAGRHLVSNGCHIQREAIEASYRSTMQSLMARI